MDPAAFFPIFLVVGFFLLSGLRVVQQYQKGVHFRLGKVIFIHEPGMTWIIPILDRMVTVNMRIQTLPIPTQKIITKDNVSIDIAAVAYYRVTDALKALIEIEDLASAIGEIAQTTVRNTMGQFMLDQVLAATENINEKLKEIIDERTEVWGAVVSLVELKDITLPESMQRAMAKEAEAEREKRAKIIAAEGEYQAAERLSQAAAVMAAQPIALQLRNLQSLVEISAEKNSTIIFPSQFFTTMRDVFDFVAQEKTALPAKPTVHVTAP
ncbi:MAG TPA: slipin family protein [Candidatus Xenobia bacterium]